MMLIQNLSFENAKNVIKSKIRILDKIEVKDLQTIRKLKNKRIIV